MSGDFKSKLQAATGTQSLRDEGLICEILEKQKWQTVHSAYYIDPAQDKDRETDIAAMQVWSRKLKRGEELFRLHMLVEAKTMKDYHILASKARNVRHRTSLHETRYWVGYDNLFASELKRRIRVVNDSPEVIDQYMDRFARMAFPGDVAVIRSLLGIQPPPAPYLVSAFRETNTAIERDLDSSVLWKAGSSLRSAFKAQISELREYHLEGLALVDETDRVRLHLDMAHSHLRVVDYYLPVVVLRSSLWLVEDNDINEIDWFRFVQYNHNTSVSWWFDVVRESYFDKYASLVTKHYAGSLRKLRGKLKI